MVNHRLRGAMLNAEATPARLAQLAEVDTKTVQRWLTEDRMPYPITRHRVARALGHEETYLWPELLTDVLDSSASRDAIAGRLADPNGDLVRNLARAAQRSGAQQPGPIPDDLQLDFQEQTCRSR